MPIADMASRRIMAGTYWSRGARVTTNVQPGVGSETEEDTRGNEEPIVESLAVGELLAYTHSIILSVI